MAIEIQSNKRNPGILLKPSEQMISLCLDQSKQYVLFIYIKARSQPIGGTYGVRLERVRGKILAGIYAVPENGLGLSFNEPLAQSERAEIRCWGGAIKQLVQNLFSSTCGIIPNRLNPLLYLSMAKASKEWG